MSPTHLLRSPIRTALLCGAILPLLSLLVPLPALAAGPFFYNGVSPSGPDAMAWDYPDVGPGQTQVVTVYLYTGDALTLGGHFGIGLRGPSVDANLPLGRGLAFGTLINTPDAYCIGVAVENFTVNRALNDPPEGLVDDNGIIDGTCQIFTFKTNTTYEIVVQATYNDVSYIISERIFDFELGRYEFLPRLGGSCRALAQAAVANGTASGDDIDHCGQQEDLIEHITENPEDRDAGDFFIGTAFVPTGLSWSSQLLVEHF